MKSIGFLGLGIMGQGMAANLAEAGNAVKVWNRTPGKAVGFPEAETPRQAAEGADVVITMLSTPDALMEVALGDDGLLAGLEKGAVLIDCSTVDPSTSRKLAAEAEARGARFMDCPVTGSKPAAESGELVFMAGGDAETLEEMRPVLDAMGRKIIHAGGVGSGSQLKLCFNLMVGHAMAALSESLVLGAKAGLDPSVILEAIGSGMVASKFYDWKGRSIIDRDFSTNFSLALMHKDLGLMLSSGQELSVPLPVTEAVTELFATAKGMFDPEADLCSLVRALEAATDTEVKRP
ncbi:MAG: NAD(P)-dependent oxidoreductase [Armatimonadota bacterium]